MFRKMGKALLKNILEKMIKFLENIENFWTLEVKKIELVCYMVYLWVDRVGAAQDPNESQAFKNVSLQMMVYRTFV